MKRRNNVLLYAFLILAIAFFTAFQAVSDGNRETFTVVIDAGHGGKDPGASGKALKEKDLALRIALKVGGYLEEHLEDVKVIYTRKTDVYVTLKNRAKIANSNNADLFVSIHANALPSRPGIYGTETYVMGTKNTGRNFEVAKRENSVILLEEDYEEKYEGFDPKSPESSIMFSIMQEAYQENSIILAESIENQFKNRAGRRSLGVKQSSLYMMWSTAMPSVLIEVGYLTNQKEEKELKNKNTQDYIASAIFRAIRDYKKYLDSTN